jgi:hypothetical protein
MSIFGGGPKPKSKSPLPPWAFDGGSYRTLQKLSSDRGPPPRHVYRYTSSMTPEDVINAVHDKVDKVGPTIDIHGVYLHPHDFHQIRFLMKSRFTGKPLTKDPLLVETQSLIFTGIGAVELKMSPTVNEGEILVVTGFRK